MFYEFLQVLESGKMMVTLHNRSGVPHKQSDGGMEEIKKPPHGNKTCSHPGANSGTEDPPASRRDLILITSVIFRIFWGNIQS